MLFTGVTRQAKNEEWEVVEVIQAIPNGQTQTTGEAPAVHALDTGSLQQHGRLRKLVHQPCGGAQCGSNSESNMSP